MEATNTFEIDAITQKNIDLWLNGDYDQETKNQIQKLRLEDPKELVEGFYKTLSFGTAGLRGIMGIGPNRMNQYTVRAAAQGLANYLKKQPTIDSRYSVLIGYDSRHHSQAFAQEAAKVLAGNGILVYLFKELRPSPLVSFGCRYKQCHAAIMITASHNPPEYNGFKVFWSDGGQISTPHDIGIMQEITRMTDPSMILSADELAHPFIEMIGQEIDNAYLDKISELQNYPIENKKNGSQLKIVYTNLHGTGITIAPKAFARWGFSTITYVEKQIIPDGNFPTVPLPNPEDRNALKLGIETLKKHDADILIATDPDADRVGIAVKHQRDVITLNGNQIACLCLYHICEALTKQNRMPEKAAFVKSIGTTELFKSIVDYYGKYSFNVLTGFKYVAQLIRNWESSSEGFQFIFAGEESYGYLFGTQTHDKDGIVAAILICEMALQAKLQGKTLIDMLGEIYRKFGVFSERLLSLNFEESKEGKDKMAYAMNLLRNHPLQSISDIEVSAIEDYQQGVKYEAKTGQKAPLLHPESDVLLYWLSDGSKLMIRPSGTEPKIKIYCGVSAKNIKSIPEALTECDKRAEKLLQAFQQLFNMFTAMPTST